MKRIRYNNYQTPSERYEEYSIEQLENLQLDFIHKSDEIRKLIERRHRMILKETRA